VAGGVRPGGRQAAARNDGPRIRDGQEKRGGGGALRVVVVDGDVSYPASSGKRLRTLNLMLRLARRHALTYIARAQQGAEQARPAAAFFRDHGIEAVLVDHPLPRKAGLGFYARLAGNLFSPLPYSAVTHDSPPLRAAVRAYAARHPVDLWQIEWTPHVAMVPASPPTRRLLVAHNVDSLIWQRYHETEANPLKRFYVRRQWRKFERFERRVFAEVDCVVAVSPEDAVLIRERFGGRRVEVVDNGIDRPFYENVRGGGKPETILFLGSLDWRPNLDGVRLLLDEVFPAVQRGQPSARLSIVGRNAPDWLRQCVAGRPGVELHADVADVRPYLAESGVLAVPLRIGGGSRLKILEALACGLPVVSTRVGTEGLCLRPGHDLVVVEGVEGMAAALLECLRDPGRALALAAEGRRLVLERYDWDVLAAKLERVWEDCVTGGAEKR
jgi:glycosyltransferase involved in cell wall biosynthesis